jgi:hypothetical protein
MIPWLVSVFLKRKETCAYADHIPARILSFAVRIAAHRRPGVGFHAKKSQKTLEKSPFYTIVLGLIQI